MKRKGFTLIELLAVVIILSILVLIAVPKINDVINVAQKGAYKSTNLMIVSELKRQNGLEITPQVYTFTNGVMSPDVGITGELPTSGTVEVNSLGQVQVVTSNDKYCAIKRFSEDDVAIFTVGDRLCNVVVEITLTVNPNGGTYEGSTGNTTYQVPTEEFQTINNPTREGYTFDGWTIEGEGTYSSWMFQAGFTDATMTAKWIIYPMLTVSPNGGTYAGSTSNTTYRVAPGTSKSISPPTRTGYVFNSWALTGGGTFSNGTFTATDSDTTLTASWTPTYTCYKNATPATYSCSSGTLSGSQCNVGTASPNVTITSTWERLWVSGTGNLDLCWYADCQSYGSGTFTCSGSPTYTIGNTASAWVSWTPTQGDRCNCNMVGSCTVTWVCSTGTLSGSSCYIPANVASYSCTEGTLSGNRCYLYNQTSCSSGWTQQ